MEMVEAGVTKARKPGRPRAIPEDIEPIIVDLYNQGYGYRAIARILRREYGLNPHYSSVRKTLIRLGTLGNGVHKHEDLS
jgi:hypothetical protein